MNDTTYCDERNLQPNLKRALRKAGVASSPLILARPHNFRDTDYFELVTDGIERTVTPIMIDGCFRWIDVDTGKIIGKEADHG